MPLTCCTPSSFFCTVVYGTITVSSWSWPIAAWPLRRQHADDAERLVVDADGRADRIGAGAEQLIARHRAEHGDLGRARHVLRREEAAELHRPRADSGSSSLVPCTCVFQLDVSAMICVRVLSAGDR